jgi:hypothetical protein
MENRQCRGFKNRKETGNTETVFEFFLLIAPTRRRYSLDLLEKSLKICQTVIVKTYGDFQVQVWPLADEACMASVLGF